MCIRDRYVGDTIRAAFDGKVRVVKNQGRRGYGKYVVIRHDNEMCIRDSPRPDERHIRRKDVYDLRPLLRTEFNIEGLSLIHILRLHTYRLYRHPLQSHHRSIAPVRLEYPASFYGNLSVVWRCV